MATLGEGAVRWSCPLPGFLALENGWPTMAEVLDKRQVQLPCGEMHAYLDHDAVDLPLTCALPGSPVTASNRGGWGIPGYPTS